MNLAARWIYHHRHWLDDSTAGIVLIQIRDRQVSRERRHLDAKPGLEQVAQTVGSVTTPPEALLSAYRSTMGFGNDEWLEVLDDHFNTHEDERFFATVSFELSKDAPLSWYITTEQREALLHEFDERPRTHVENANPAALAALVKWWRERAAP